MKHEKASHKVNLTEDRLISLIRFMDEIEEGYEIVIRELQLTTDGGLKLHYDKY